MSRRNPYWSQGLDKRHARRARRRGWMRRAVVFETAGERVYYPDAKVSIAIGADGTTHAEIRSNEPWCRYR